MDDFDLAFDLQLEEAMIASLASQTPAAPSTASSSGIPRQERFDWNDFLTAHSHASSSGIPRQERFDWNDFLTAHSETYTAFPTVYSSSVPRQSQRNDLPASSPAASSSSTLPEQERKRFKPSQWDDNINIRLAGLAEIFKNQWPSEIDTGRIGRRSDETQLIRDEDRNKWSCSLDKPFNEGCSKGVENEGVFRLYFKGMVLEDWVGDKRRVLGGIGIAICDSVDNLVFQESKPLFGNGTGKIFAEARALIEGLNAAICLGLERITIYCDYYPLYQFVSRRWPPKRPKVVTLLNEVYSLQKEFVSCNPYFVARQDIKFAFKLARDAIFSQVNCTKDAARASDRKLNESCVICLEDCDVNRMFSVAGCFHRYCFSCMKQHVEVKLLQGMLPKCPHEGCKVGLDVDSCAKFLTAKDIAIMRQRIKEASIPISEKVYCPYPRCSALMSKGEVLEYTKDVLCDANESKIRKCMKCYGLFCINCKVPWHSDISCNDYERSQRPQSEDVKLKSLASKKLWRQCVKCNHMIELAEGCYHITCRCGYEFCYYCGAEWKKRKDCSCPLWDQTLILSRLNRDFDEEDGDFDEEDDEELYGLFYNGYYYV